MGIGCFTSRFPNFFPNTTPYYLHALSDENVSSPANDPCTNLFPSVATRVSSFPTVFCEKIKPELIPVSEKSLSGDQPLPDKMRIAETESGCVDVQTFVQGAVIIKNQIRHISLAYFESGLPFQSHQPHSRSPCCRPWCQPAQLPAQYFLLLTRQTSPEHHCSGIHGQSP